MSFTLVNGELCAEAVPLQALGQQYGTPLYVYSAAQLRANFKRLRDALPDVAIHYAVKANSNLAILRLLGLEGAGADIVSGGELQRALRAGIAANKVVFSGVGKTEAELEAALKANIHQLNVESIPELTAIDLVAARLGVVANVALRLNPDVAADTHHKIATGKKGDKFGIDYEQMFEAAKVAAALPNLNLCGIAIHIGSQIFDIETFRAAYARTAGFVRELRSAGHNITRLDLGGGFAVPYDGEAPFDVTAYAAMVQATLGDLGCALAIEPGRFMVANAGLLLCRVVYVKEGVANRFVVVDAAMNDLVRPAMYESFHNIQPVVPGSAAPQMVDIVGPVCESSDVFGTARLLPPMQAGDLVAMHTAGAYGAAMSSTYNTRDLVPEVLVDGNRHAIIRPRITAAEQIAWDRVPDWL